MPHSTEFLMNKSSNKTVYFYTTSTEWTSLGARGAWFQDLIVNLATGFQDLGVQYYSSHNYWRLHPDKDEYLLQYNPSITHHDCDIVVLERQWVEENGSLPSDLFHSRRHYITVYLDCADGLVTNSWLPEFRQFDFILKTHYIKNFNYPSNVYPWAFGLSSRVLSQFHNYLPVEARAKKVAANFPMTDEAIL